MNQKQLVLFMSPRGPIPDPVSCELTDSGRESESLPRFNPSRPVQFRRESRGSPPVFVVGTVYSPLQRSGNVFTDPFLISLTTTWFQDHTLPTPPGPRFRSIRLHPGLSKSVKSGSSRVRWSGSFPRSVTVSHLSVRRRSGVWVGHIHTHVRTLA